MGYVVSGWSDRCLSCVVMHVAILDFHALALWFVLHEGVCCFQIVVALGLADLFDAILQYTWLPNCSYVCPLYMFELFV